MKNLVILTIFCIAIKTTFSITCNFGTVSNGTHCEECGLTDVAANAKIVGGVQAVPYSWPSQAFIIENVDDVFELPDGSFDTVQTFFMCGGTIINRYTILTAAHCINFEYTYKYEGENIYFPLEPTTFYPTIESRFLVYLGMHNVSNLQLNPKPPAAVFEVSKIIMHPNYDDFSFQNDIALLILKIPITYSKFIKPECLPKAKDLTFPLPNSNVFIAGWGDTKENGFTSDLLLNLKLTVYNSSLCQPVLPELTKNWNSQICAGYLPGGKDTCQGDSGGGLHILDTSLNKTIRVVSGIVSYGDGCARKNSPGIYTRTSFFLDWIYANWVVDAKSLTTTTTAKASTTTTKAPTTTTKAPIATSKLSNTTVTTTKVTTTTKTTTRIPTVSILSTIKTNTTLRNNSTLTTSNNLLTTSRPFNIQTLIEFLSVLQNILAYFKNYF